jgi:nicotinamidase-related amidase
MTAKGYAPFLKWLDEWYAELKPVVLREIVGDPAGVAIFSQDMVNGFCFEGNLASPRVAALVTPVVDLFRRAHDLGVRHFVLMQDTHNEHAAEFKQFPPHCIRGTSESQTVDALRALPFASEYRVVKKNSLHPALNTDLDQWLDTHQDLGTLIVVGDCTDLCTYQSATYLKLRANARDLPRRVIVPADAVDTYDLPVATAVKIGVLPHDGELLHRIFLYHLALCGIEVVKHIA